MIPTELELAVLKDSLSSRYYDDIRAYERYQGYGYESVIDSLFVIADMPMRMLQCVAYDVSGDSLCRTFIKTRLRDKDLDDDIMKDVIRRHIESDQGLMGAFAGAYKADVHMVKWKPITKFERI